MGVFIPLELPTAFDTVDQDRMSSHLQQTFSVDGLHLSLISSRPDSVSPSQQSLHVCYVVRTARGTDVS